MQVVSRGAALDDPLKRPIGAAQRWRWMLTRTVRLWRATPRQLGRAQPQLQRIEMRRR